MNKRDAPEASRVRVTEIGPPAIPRVARHARTRPAAKKSLTRPHVTQSASLRTPLSSIFRFAQYRSNTTAASDARVSSSNEWHGNMRRQKNHRTSQSCLECRLRTKMCPPHCPERARWPAHAKMRLRFSCASSEWDEHQFQPSQVQHYDQHVMRVDRSALCMLGAVSKRPFQKTRICEV